MALAHNSPRMGKLSSAVGNVKLDSEHCHVGSGWSLRIGSV